MGAQLALRAGQLVVIELSCKDKDFTETEESTSEHLQMSHFRNITRAKNVRKEQVEDSVSFPPSAGT